MADPYLGEIRMFGFGGSNGGCPVTVPSRWLPADGRLLPISGNSALFSLLGTAYGGDGSTTFALPDLRGRVPIHEGQGPGLTNRVRGLGSRGGSETVTLQQANLPSISATATIAGIKASLSNDGAVSGSFDGSGDHFHTVDNHIHPFTYDSFTFPDAASASATMDIDNIETFGGGFTRGLRGLKEKKEQAEAHKVRRLGMPQDNAANIEVLQTLVDGIIAAGSVGPQGKLIMPYLSTATSYPIHASHSHP